MEEILRLAALMAGCGDMLSFDRLVSIAYHVLQTQSLSGTVGEFGCFEGRTAMFMTSLTPKRIHLYDSFQGLPERQEEDAHSVPWFVKGHLATSQHVVLNNFRRANLRSPTLHPGWFADLGPDDFPDMFSFVHVDGDFYSSIKDALACAYPRMIPGGVMLIDDYGWSDLPGVKKATDEFFADKPEKPVRLCGLSAICANQAFVMVSNEQA
jgi:O-methyltransferase